MIYCIKYCQPTEDWKLAVDLIQTMDCWCSFQRVCSNTEQISSYSAKKWMLKRKSFGFYIKISSNLLPVFHIFTLFKAPTVKCLPLSQILQCTLSIIPCHLLNSYTVFFMNFIFSSTVLWNLPSLREWTDYSLII